MLVTKSTYAAMRDRAPSAVSNWIADGKLTAPALVQDAEGGEMIDPDLADRQLSVTLHPSQQAAQPTPISLHAAGPKGEEEEKAGAADDPDNRRFVKARADRMEAEAEGLARKRQEETGKWVEAEKARADFAKEMASSISEAEAWLLGATSEIVAAELNVERAAVVAIFRREWRSFRARQAAAKRGALAAPVAMAAE